MPGPYKAMVFGMVMWLGGLSTLSHATSITAGPYLQAATATSMVIMWETDQPQTGAVDYGVSSAYGETQITQPKRVPKTSVAGDTPAILHEARLLHLTPGQVYHYRVRTDSEQSADATFATPSTAGPWRFLHTSSPNAYAPGKSKITLASMIRADPDFVIISGDVTNNATNNDFRQFVQRAHGLVRHTTVYTCQGNHDNRAWSRYTDWMNNTFADSFNERFFAFDIGPAHFIGVDDSVHHTDFPRAWFQQQLKHSKARWTVVFLNGNYRKKKWMQDVLEANKAGIDVILTSGRGAQYVDRDGILHLESGGLGFVYHEIEMTWTSWRATLHASDGRKMRTIVAGQAATNPPVPPQTDAP